MLTNTGTDIATNPIRNSTMLAVHCVVRTLRKPSWANHKTSVYNPAKIKNKITSPTMIATVIASGARLRIETLDEDEVTN
jgi:hypothetical protein